MPTPEQELAWLNADWEHLRKKTRGPQKLDDVIARLMAKRGYAQVLANEEWSAVWREVAGPNLAAHTRLGKLSRRVLDIVVRNSIVQQEIAFQKRQLLEKLQARLPQERISDLRFRVGDIS